MNLRIAALLALTALAGFGASCSQPPAQTASQTQADPASPSAPVDAATTIAAAATQNATSLAGTYEGEFEGASAQVTISGAAPRYTVHILIGADGCAGGALGPAQASSAGVLTMRPSDDASCTITMTPTAGGFAVQERQCSNLHGDLCSFNGELHRAR